MVLLRMNLKFYVIVMNDQISAIEETAKIEDLVKKELTHTVTSNKISSLTLIISI